MIRMITVEDAPIVVKLAVDSGLFPVDGVGVVENMLTDYFGGNIKNGHRCVIDDKAQGVAYYAPAPAADRTWYLTMIAVHRDFQGSGGGSALMQHIENALQVSGQRLLLVETSGLPVFERTRNFYKKCGYEQEARVRDFYAVGDDMVLFRKVLNRE